jgi:hypothetical protein
MANLKNMGVGKKLLNQVLSLTGPKVKHWYNQQNLTANKSISNQSKEQSKYNIHRSTK